MNTAHAVISQHGLNWVDFIIIGIIFISVLISFFRGLIREAISLGFWLVGLMVALKFALPVHEYLSHWIGSPMLRYLLAFVGLFLIVFVIGVITNLLIQAMVKAAGLSFTDRLLGIFFGAARGLAIVTVLLLFVSSGTLQDAQAIQQSRLAPQFMPLVSWLRQFLPDHMQTVSNWVQPDPQQGYTRPPQQRQSTDEE